MSTTRKAPPMNPVSTFFPPLFLQPILVAPKMAFHGRCRLRMRVPAAFAKPIEP